MPAREGEGGAASASCEQRLRRPGRRGLGETPEGADAGAERAALHAAAQESCFKGTVSQALLEDVDL